MAEEHDNSRKSLTARLLAGAGERIKEERERRGWTQQQLAEKAGTSQQTINRIERGVTVHSRAIPAAEAALGIKREGFSLAAVNDRIDALMREASTRENYAPPVISHEQEIEANQRIPVFSSLLSEGAICRSKMPFRWMTAPEPLVGVQGAFALVVFEEAMAPAYGPGDIILVNPMLKPRPRGDALLISADSGPRKIHIGQVLTIKDDAWVVRQLDGEDLQIFERPEWSAYTIVGRFIRA